MVGAKIDSSVSRHPCAREVAATGVWTKGDRQLEKKLSCAGRAGAWEELRPHPQAAPTLFLPSCFLFEIGVCCVVYTGLEPIV